MLAVLVALSVSFIFIFNIERNSIGDLQRNETLTSENDNSVEYQLPRGINETLEKFLLEKILSRLKCEIFFSGLQHLS